MAWPVWLFVPNLIGYVRIITGLAAFHYAWDTEHILHFFFLYGFSYLLDAVDGVAARKLNQKSSFGAVLDMVTDRFCTAGLLAVLAFKFQEPMLKTAFVWLMILDIVSHWVQMYSSLRIGTDSHKNISEKEHPLLRFYYMFPYALFWVCLFNETALVMLFLVAHEDTQLVKSIPAIELPQITNGGVPLHRLALYVSFPIFVLKQTISVIQLHGAAKRILAVDEQDRAEAAEKQSN